MQVTSSGLTDVRIREATLADDAALASIDHASWSPLTDPGEHWDADRPFFGPPTGARPEETFVAEVSGRPTGVIKVRRDECEFGDWCINGIAVATEFQDRGIGTQLISAACDRASDNGAASVWLKVLGSNERAVALYTRLGFREVACFTSPFPSRPGVDDLRMTKQLTHSPQK